MPELSIVARMPTEESTRVVLGRWYPDMPPKLVGESPAEYTDRLTGADRSGRQPYDHHRFRQCSIGHHGECSDADGGSCECPCHRETGEPTRSAPPVLVRRGQLGWGNRKTGLEAYGEAGRWGGEGTHADWGDLLGDYLEREGASEGADLVVVVLPRWCGLDAVEVAGAVENLLRLMSGLGAGDA